MSFELTIPQVAGGHFNHTLEVGKCVFVVGPNGSGKSSLMHYIYKSHRGAAWRMTAHRQTWLTSNAIDLSPYQKQQRENQIEAMDAQDQARWKDDHSAVRPSIAIFDLIDAENVRARAIAEAMDANDIPRAQSLAEEAAPIKIINEILRLSNIPITISVQKNQEVMAFRNGGELYSAAELSDGERNAMLIAASVLTVEPGTLILIDEPERHLHRSISSPLLTQLFRKRPDCAFLISTHEVSLPLDNDESSILLIRNCTYSGSGGTAWEIDLVPSDCDIDEEVKADILGQRRNMLFIEGNETTSLDKPMYSLIFPDISVIPKASCKDVETAVYGITDSEELHWLRALGIIDNDGRSEADIENLSQKGIYALSVYSVESIYYHPDIQYYVANRHSLVTGEEPGELLSGARTAAIDAIRPHTRRLAERRAEKKARERVFEQLPNKKSISAGININVEADVASIVSTEVSAIEKALAQGDLEALVQKYPLRETPALDRIALALRFKDREQYESSVRTMLLDDENALSFTHSLFGPLKAAIQEQ